MPHGMTALPLMRGTKDRSVVVLALQECGTDVATHHSQTLQRSVLGLNRTAESLFIKARSISAKDQIPSSPKSSPMLYELRSRALIWSPAILRSHPIVGKLQPLVKRSSRAEPLMRPLQACASRYSAESVRARTQSLNSATKL